MSFDPPLMETIHQKLKVFFFVIYAFPKVYSTPQPKVTVVDESPAMVGGIKSTHRPVVQYQYQHGRAEMNSNGRHRPQLFRSYRRSMVQPQHDSKVQSQTRRVVNRRSLASMGTFPRPPRVQLQRRPMDQPQHSPLGQSQYRPMGQYQYRPMDQSQYRPMGQYQRKPMGQSHLGSLDGQIKAKLLK